VKQLRVIVELRNNLLQQRREDLGMTQAALCRAALVDQSRYSAWEKMKLSPFIANGDWQPGVLKIATFHGLAPEELFPPEVLKMRGGKREMTCDVTEFAELAAGGPEALLALRNGIGRARALLSDTCTPREAAILTARLGLDGAEPKTCEKVAGKLGVTRERIRQLEAAGVRKIRRALEDSEDRREEEAATERRRRNSGKAGRI
jgi:transcriptional regulator with XRE-family HTH domain